MANSTLGRLGHRTYGVAFLLVIALLLSLSIASFKKVFTDVVEVTLNTDRIGSQMQAASDVKIRGLIVGEVRSIDSTPAGATLHLALKPEMVPLIPAKVSARLLPKTLFGERYVDLVAPAGEPGRAIRAGDVIPQDRTTVAIELEQVFEDLLPLLRSIEPAKLAATLNALATALDGRGTKLGKNLVLVDEYFTQLNPHMPTIQADISGLADLASTYAVAAPELLRAAKALLTTNATIVEKQKELSGFLAGTAGFANTTAGFLETNQNRIIQVGRVQRPTLQVLAKHSPIYPCFTQGLVRFLPRAEGIVRDGVFHITLEMAPQREPYHPGEEPAWGEKRAPNCHGLPNNTRGSQANPAGATKFDDGTDGATTGASMSTLPQAFLAPGAARIPAVDAGVAGTIEEQKVVGALVGVKQGEDASLATLLAGPMLRGMVVNQ
ncbi:mammalian cell entry protein [Knoellia sinensis KCTC 19936]|uniref:Mammalian cell entry protein n=1 Tax=Knoellia sinensis KCTC 19936 TaxID=1385520 RepID=A0A0A0JCM8_9MICO|nr:MCE family protein [Knoellia sinensis]KGN33782.1 mammalian cell entry protein [Knoellia sinensis KCTC 19936]